MKVNFQRFLNLIQSLIPDPLVIRPVWINLDSGYRLKIDSKASLELFVDIFSSQQYKPALDLMNNCEWVVDLGANRGLFTIYVLHYLKRHGILHTPKILCIEPARENYKGLLDNINQNSLSGQIIPVRGIVTNKRSGEVPFYYATRSHGMSTVVKNDRITTHRLRVIDVSEYLTFPRIDLLKVDIEGSEQAFLQEYPEILRKTSLLIAEFHLQQINYSICQSILESQGLFFYQRVFSISDKLFIDIFRRSGEI